MAEHEAASSRFTHTTLPLRIVSILLIVLAVVSFFIVAMVGLVVVLVSVLGVDGSYAFDFGDSSLEIALNVISTIVSIITSVIQFIAGWKGLKLARGEEKAETCQLLGILLIGLAVIAWLCNIAASGLSAMSAIDFLLSFALPGFYYALAHHQKRSSWVMFQKVCL